MTELRLSSDDESDDEFESGLFANSAHAYPSDHRDHLNHPHPEGEVDQAKPVDPSRSAIVAELYEKHRRPGRFVLVLDDGKTFVVSLGVLADIGATRVGAKLSAQSVAMLEIEGRIIAIMDRALASLGRARRSRRELEQRMRKHEPERDIVASALDRLYASGVVSDESTARAEASSRLRRGEAPMRVKQRLRGKGIDGAVVDEAIKDAVRDDEFDELSACKQAAERRMRSLASLEPAVAKRRLIGFLQRRGFATSAIITAISDHFESR